MLDNDFEKICSHLEYLGYTIELSEGIYFVKHKKKDSVVLEKTQIGLKILTVWSAKSNIDTALNEYHLFINSLNRVTILGNYHTISEDDPTLAYRAFFICPYEKQLFSNFMDKFDYDIQNIYNSDIGNGLKYLK